MECPPRYGTPRNPARPTLGPAVGVIAALLGTPLMEWQQSVADVLLEVQSEAAGDPSPGELAYDEWTLTVPRQSGKSTLLLAKASHRASATKFFGPAQNLVYTAQTKLKATEKFEREYARAIKRATRLKALARTGNQKTDIRYPNGSVFSAEATTEKAGHGSTLDEAYIDEAFAQPDNRLEQAFGPAMITRANSQLGAVSTAGWLDASPYLLEKVTLGRSLVASGVQLGTAYFEWSAPDDADPGDEAVWLACMPALHRPECNTKTCRRHTVTVGAIRSQYDKAVRSGKLSDFRRAYLNQWRPKPKEGDETALGNWNACHADRLEAEDREAVLAEPLIPKAVGLAGNLDRTIGSIGAAVPLSDGRLRVGKVDRAEGIEWLVDRAKELQDRYDCEVVVDEKGPIGDLIPALEAAGVRVRKANLNDYVAACADIYDRVQGRRLVHEGHPDLDKSVEGARWRTVGDRRVFGRKQSEEDIALTEAVTLAAWATEHAASSGFNIW